VMISPPFAAATRLRRERVNFALSVADVEILPLSLDVTDEALFVKAARLWVSLQISSPSLPEEFVDRLKLIDSSCFWACGLSPPGMGEFMLLSE